LNLHLIVFLKEAEHKFLKMKSQCNK
jgi:hypothetical protein